MEDRITSYNVCYTKLLRVVAIIAILGTVIAVNLMDKTSDAKVASANTNAQSIHSAVNIYLQEQVIEGDAVPNGCYQSGDSSNSYVTAMKKAIGTNVKGNWALEINNSGVEYVVWSETATFAVNSSTDGFDVTNGNGITAVTGPVTEAT